jgi:hypothetical protein
VLFNTSKIKCLAALCAAAALVPASAAAAPPTIVRDEIDDTFVDELLSEACGVQANVHVTGFTISRIREDGGVLEVFTANVTAVVTSEFGSFTAKDVGSESARISPDGQVIVSISGQTPFRFKGVLKFKGITGEELNEPNLAASEREIERACAVLNPQQ